MSSSSSLFPSVPWLLYILLELVCLCLARTSSCLMTCMIALSSSALSFSADKLDSVRQSGMGEGSQCIFGIVRSKKWVDFGGALGMRDSSAKTTDATSSSYFRWRLASSLYNLASSSASKLPSSLFTSLLLSTGIMSSSYMMTGSFMGLCMGLRGTSFPAFPLSYCYIPNWRIVEKMFEILQKRLSFHELMGLPRTLHSLFDWSLLLQGHAVGYQAHLVAEWCRPGVVLAQGCGLYPLLGYVGMRCHSQPTPIPVRPPDGPDSQI